jgi:hypothetical protein
VGSGYAPSVIVDGGYETFCISRNAFLDALPGLYNYNVDTNGVYLPDGAMITKGMAILYSQFASNSLAGYRYGDLANRPADADSLQLAFWVLEIQYNYGGNIDPLSGTALELALASNPFLLQIANFFGGGTNGLLAAMMPNTPGGYNVGALNLTYAVDVVDAHGNTHSAGAVAQPLLVLLPPPPVVCTDNICGKIFADCDGSGDLTVGDAGLKNVLVKLVNSGGTIIGSIYTDTNGAYCFGNLIAGTYTVMVTPPSGYKQTAASTGYHWRDRYARDCWFENDGYIHCKNNGTECWQAKDGCMHWKDNYGRDCWNDKYGSFRCQSWNYKSCNAQTNNNTLSVTLTNCQSQYDVNFSYTGSAPKLSVCVSAPTSAKCGQTITYTCTVTNTGNVCFKGGTVCHTVGNCGWWGWQGSTCNFTSNCPQLSPGQGCVITQKCTIGWYNTGNFGCQTTVKCAQPSGYSATGQASCNTQVNW